MRCGVEEFVLAEGRRASTSAGEVCGDVCGWIEFLACILPPSVLRLLGEAALSTPETRRDVECVSRLHEVCEDSDGGGHPSQHLLVR